MRKEFNPFRSDRAPLTNWVGHQVTKVVSAGSAAFDKAKDKNVNYRHAYSKHLLHEQKYDYLRGNALTAIALLAASLAVNSIR